MPVDLSTEISAAQASKFPAPWNCSIPWHWSFSLVLREFQVWTSASLGCQSRTRVIRGQGWRLMKHKAEPWSITLHEASEINLSTWCNWKNSCRWPVTGILRWSSRVTDPNQKFKSEHVQSTGEGLSVRNAYSPSRPGSKLEPGLWRVSGQ